MIETILSPVNIIVGLYSVLNLITWSMCEFGQTSACVENFPYIPLVLLLMLEVIRRWVKNKSQPSAYTWKKKVFIRLIILIALDLLPIVGIFSSPYGGFAIWPLVLINAVVLIIIVAKAIEDYKNQSKPQT